MWRRGHLTVWLTHTCTHGVSIFKKSSKEGKLYYKTGSVAAFMDEYEYTVPLSLYTLSRFTFGVVHA